SARPASPRRANVFMTRGLRQCRNIRKSAPGLSFPAAAPYIPPGVYRQVPHWGRERYRMTHAVHEKQKLLNRVRRLRGQVDAIERALEAEDSCTQVMRLLTAARGAMNGMMAE